MFAETLEVVSMQLSRADNKRGLAYYAKMGVWKNSVTANVQLTVGTPVDPISKNNSIEMRKYPNRNGPKSNLTDAAPGYY